MSAYLIANYDIEDPKAYESYVLAADPLLEKYGGEILVADDEAKIIEGRAGKVGVVIKFASEAAVTDFYNDPDYRVLKQIRHDATTNGSVMLAMAHDHAAGTGQEK